MRLQDKVCIITGSALGIGREAALLFAREGAKVVVADILEKEGRDVADIITKEGGDAVFLKVNVQEEREIERMVSAVVGKYNRINVLYNNAGISRVKEDFLIENLKQETWNQIMDVNAKGTFLCCKYVIPELIKSGGGSIINTASTGGVVGLEMPAYCASKGAIIALTRSIARQYGDMGIRVNAICPTTVNTRMASSSREMRAQRKERFPRHDNLLRRIGEPEEIAYLSLYLSSDESSFVTGGIFLIDGGLTAV